MKGRRRRGPFIFTLTETGSKEGFLRDDSRGVNDEELNGKRTNKRKCI